MYNDLPARIEDEMTDAGKASGPRVVKGGVFAPADIELVKDALLFYMMSSESKLRPEQSRRMANLFHRLNNRI